MRIKSTNCYRFVVLLYLISYILYYIVSIFKMQSRINLQIILKSTEKYIVLNYKIYIPSLSYGKIMLTLSKIKNIYKSIKSLQKCKVINTLNARVKYKLINSKNFI